MKLNEKFTVIILVFVFVPIVVFSMMFFRNMEENTIKEERKTLEYSLERSHDVIIKNVENINMSTQFFLSDKMLMEYLEKIGNKEEISYEEMMNFYNVNIASLERMINSNPYIYQIRVYVDSADAEEMMPILYRYDRMQRLARAQDGEVGGWKYDYRDTLFESYAVSRSERLMALVTPVETYDGTQMGTLEVALKMQTMFPAIYDNKEGGISFFIDKEGNLYCNDAHKEGISAYLEANPQEGNREKKENLIRYEDWQGQKIVVGTRYIKELDGTFVSINSLQNEIGALHKTRNIFLAVMVFISVALAFLVDFVVKRLLARFYQILKSIREVQKGNLNVEIQDCGTDEMGELGNQVNKMLEKIRILMEDNLNRERLVKNSEIRALQNQINAHFIYNVLESIKMMAEIDEKYDISDAVTSLGKLLRYSMRWTAGNVTVGEELEYIRNYLALINLRFDYEIYLSLNMPDIILRQEIPKMSLQPIVENAIHHGIEQIAEDTNIYVKGMITDGGCIIEITDAGKGMTDEKVHSLQRRINGELETDDAGDGKCNGIGLKNVQDRIQIQFGEDYGLHIASKLGCYTKVQVKIPQTYFGTQKEEENA